MFCCNCGQELPDGAKFCFNCGNRMETVTGNFQKIEPGNPPLKSRTGLINAKCTNCGAALEVDQSKDAAICKYCGSAFIVEKAIHNYNITHNQHISAETINIISSGTDGFDIWIGRLRAYNGQYVDVKIPDSVRIIENEVFRGKPINSVEIPRSVEYIGHMAFYGTNITRLVIPSSVKQIGDSAFAYNVLLRDIVFENGKNDGAFEIARGVEHIGERAFYCTSITRLVIPASVKRIENDAFANNQPLSEIVFEGAPDTGVQIVSGCKNLKNVVIKDAAFKHFAVALLGCSSVENISGPDELQQNIQEFLNYHNRKRWMSEGKCSFCGGDLSKGLIKRCSICNRKRIID